MGEEKNVNAAISYGVDSNWYADSGATDHVTGELDKLAVKDAYNGNEQIYNTSGSGMRIEHVGESVIHTPYRDLRLKHALHVPQATKNLPLFIELPLTIMFSLNVILTSFLLRVRSREELSYTVDPREVCTRFHVPRLLE
jgi:hypothetical protein